MKTPLRLVAIVACLHGAGCVTEPDAEERAARRERMGYMEIEETGSRIKRKVPLADVNAATMAGASAVDKNGGAGMRDRNTTLPEAIGGR